MPASAIHESLHGRTVIITRPAGTAGAMARQVRKRGGVPLLMPGLALRKADDDAAAHMALRAALADDLLIFTSPAAVRFAAALMPLRTRAIVLAVGAGTARALHRHGIEAQVPMRQDSEGVLAQPVLQSVHGVRVALIGAPGGRGLLRDQLAAGGAKLREVHVYRRTPARLDRRHHDAATRLPPSALLLLSSVESLHNLLRQLPPAALQRLLATTAVVSSERLAAAARDAGFSRIVRAPSALGANLLEAAMHAD